MILRSNNKLRSLPSNKSQFTMVINLMGFRPEDLFFLFFSLAAFAIKKDFLLRLLVSKSKRGKKSLNGKIGYFGFFSAES
jgi:hypothetical protein